MIARPQQAAQGQGDRVRAAVGEQDTTRIRGIDQLSERGPRLADQPIHFDGLQVHPASGGGSQPPLVVVDGPIDSIGLGPTGRRVVQYRCAACPRLGLASDLIHGPVGALEVRRIDAVSWLLFPNTIANQLPQCPVVPTGP